MKFGLVPVNVGFSAPEPMAAIAQRAEELGFESVWTFEHVMVPTRYRSRYPYSDDGRAGIKPETPFVDPFVALAWIAASTTVLRLGTGVNVLPQSNPLRLAKQAASLDFISGGRFMLGVGLGWLEEEFVALGVPYAHRGARFDDYVTAIRKVWKGDEVSHQSELLEWNGFKSYPLPVQQPRLPIIVGGATGRTYQRIARHGDGWFAPIADPWTLSEALDDLESACEEEGRDLDEIEITCMWAGLGGREFVDTLSELGVSRVVTPLPALGERPLPVMEKLAREMIG